MRGPPRKYWPAVKLVLGLALVAGVGWHFARLLGRPELWEAGFALRPAPLAASAALYLLAHCCFARFWVALLRGQGQAVGVGLGLRAYFVSQLGKYVPGKAWVIVLRVGLLRAAGVPVAVVAVTAVFETITSMSVGAIVGAALLPFAAGADGALEGRWAVLAAVMALPVLLVALNRFLVVIARKRRGPGLPDLPSVGLPMLARGMAIATGGWALMGLSLWMCVQGLVPEPGELTVLAWVSCTAIVALAYSVGFIVLVAPAGVGAREFLLQVLLTPELALVMPAPAAAAVAVVVTLVLRLVWTAAEMAVIAAAYRHSPKAAEAPGRAEGAAA
jgi:uncharacterized membrane protein YbhN (UPF0104 family)